MKRYLIILAVALAGCAGKTKTANTKDTAAKHNTAAIQYTCSMHPKVVSDKPGTCSECGMDLTEKD